MCGTSTRIVSIMVGVSIGVVGLEQGIWLGLESGLRLGLLGSSASRSPLRLRACAMCFGDFGARLVRCQFSVVLPSNKGSCSCTTVCYYSVVKCR